MNTRHISEKEIRCAVLALRVAAVQYATDAHTADRNMTDERQRDAAVRLFDGFMAQSADANALATRLENCAGLDIHEAREEQS